MSRSSTPTTAFQTGTFDRMMECNFIKDLILNSGAVYYRNFLDQKLVFKIHDPDPDDDCGLRQTKYEAILMGRFRNDRVVADCFTVLERSSPVCISRLVALEELLDVLELKLLSLPGF